MTLSDEQMSCVTGSENSTWKNIPLPTGIQSLPVWCLDAHVNWHDGVANMPTITIKVRGTVQNWTGKVWRKEGKGAYIAAHPDGRCCVHYHEGQVSMAKVADRRNWKPNYDFDGSNGPKFPPEVEVMATAQQSGYGGAHFWLKMTDGSDLVLRGPWHGGPPPGYVEVYCNNVEGEYYNSEKPGKERPWYRRSSSAGLFISEDLFLRIVAAYLPHIRVASVEKSFGRRLEAYRAEWDSLKYDIYTLERVRAINNEPAGQFWRTYWDGTTAYCGNLRVPTYGFRPEVMESDKPSQKEINAAEALRLRRGF